MNIALIPGPRDEGQDGLLFVQHAACVFVLLTNFVCFLKYRTEFCYKELITSLEKPFKMILVLLGLGVWIGSLHHAFLFNPSELKLSSLTLL